jgi:transcriptional regulator with XRE-family HTH domain
MITPDQIKKARLDAKLTQQAAADLVGITLKAWQHYEYALRNIPPLRWKLFLRLTEQPNGP